MTLSPTHVPPESPTAEILPFRAGAPRRRTGPSEGGRILLFTGVRYERMPEPPPSAGLDAAAPRRRRRS